MEVTIALTEFLSILAIVLGLVALVVTIIGFFASLKFYRDGIKMQQAATNALVRIEEKTTSIHSHVGDMFGKTLDALIGKSPGPADQQVGLFHQRLKPNISTVEPSDEAISEPPDLLQKANEYLAFKGWQFTDVTGGTERGLFGLGSSNGFNLLNHNNQMVFFGYFPRFSQAQIIAKVNYLLVKLVFLEKQIGEADGTQALRDEAFQILDRIRIEVLIPEDTDIEKMESKLSEFHPKPRRFSTKFLKSSDMSMFVEEEYKKFEP